MAFPLSPPPVPAVVRAFAAGRPVRAVWVNEMGGVTYRIGTRLQAEFIKVTGAGLRTEAWRLRWAARYTAVPQVLDVGLIGGRAWLRTRGLAGLSAVHPRWLASPDTWAIGAGLRALHERLPVGSCLAVATRSIGWNYPDRSLEAEFFAAYGVEPDSGRIDYYRQLWNAEDVAAR